MQGGRERKLRGWRKFVGTKRGRAAGEDGVYRNDEWGNCRRGWCVCRVGKEMFKMERGGGVNRKDDG